MDLSKVNIYTIKEEKNHELKLGYAFEKSPVLPLTDELKEVYSKLKEGDEITIEAKDSGTEASYEITGIQINCSPEHKQSILMIFVKRNQMVMRVWPTYCKHEIIPIETTQRFPNRVPQPGSGYD